MKVMLTSIGIDDFDSEIKAKKRPILLACIRRDYEYKEQAEILESVSERYGDELKVWLLDEDFIGVYRRLGIAGTPTFIIFYEGREKGRMLGKANRKTLSSFILRSLPSFQDNNKARTLNRSSRNQS
jgi:hypothetical protein